jgi:hypothetical protein
MQCSPVGSGAGKKFLRARIVDGAMAKLSRQRQQKGLHAFSVVEGVL